MILVLFLRSNVGVCKATRNTPESGPYTTEAVLDYDLYVDTVSTPTSVVVVVVDVPQSHTGAGCRMIAPCGVDDADDSTVSGAVGVNDPRMMTATAPMSILHEGTACGPE